MALHIVYKKVKRNTAYIGNILDKILEKEHNLSREILLYSAGLMRNGIIELLKGGKAVDLLEMGVLYIKPKSRMVKNCLSITDIPDMILSFLHLILHWKL